MISAAGSYRVRAGAVAALGGTAIRAPRGFAATAPSGPPASTLPLPTTTEPEQLLLTWGASPVTQVTVSWSAGHGGPAGPGLGLLHPADHGRQPWPLIKLPDPSPLDVTRRHDDAASVSFTDDLDGQTTYFYHVQLSDLWPATRYCYKIGTPNTAPEKTTAGAQIPNGTTAYSRCYTGTSSPTPRTTRWSPTTARASPTCRPAGWRRPWPRPATTGPWT